MEEPKKGSPASEDRSQKTAAALRALREGLGSKLETQRRRITDLEADLTSRVLEIAEEIADDQAAEAKAGSLLHDDQVRRLQDTIIEREATIAKLQRQLSDAELHQLRLSAELTDSRSAMGAAKSKECASCGSLRSQLTNAKDEISAANATIASLESRVEELLKVVSRAQDALVQLRDTESTECAQLHADLVEQQSKIEVATELAAQLESRVETLSQELTQSREAEQKLRNQHNVDNATQIKAQLAIAQVQQELSDRTAELTAASERETAAAERTDELLKQIESLTAELSEARATQAELTTQTSANDAALAESQTEAAEAKRLLKEQAAELAASTERESQAKIQIDELTARVDTLTKELDKARELEGRLAAEQSESSSTLHELQRALTEAQQSLENRAAELAEVSERESQANTRIEELADKVEALTRELNAAHDSEAELHTLHTADGAALAEARLAAEETQRLLDERTAELAAAKESESAVNSRVETLLAQMESLTADLTAAREAESKLLAQNSAVDEALVESQETATETHERLQEATEQLAAAAAREEQANARIDELSERVESLASELVGAREAEAELREQHSSEDATLSRATKTAIEAQETLRAELGQVAAERESLAQELAQVRSELAARAESAGNEVTWLQKEREAAEQSRNQLAADFEGLLKQHKETEEALAEAQSQNSQAAEALQQAEEQIEKLSASADDELAQARKKFELALADAQKLKRENAELQEELVRRPEVAETESPELVSLRVERDALAARVAELEAAPPPAADEDSEQRFSDLQRRFELAVEDLRHLKQENAQLQDKLAHASQRSSTPVAAASNQAMDWQAQKARLLAALESEDAEESPGPERRQELVTIEGTISITDRVVADKDREIAELREQLAERPVEVVEKSPATELLDKDEIIAAERAKLEALQKEWHDKLRTAELEMSLQRATLARREAEIGQKLQEAQQAQADPATGPDGKPRRRWLSALGLREDEEGKK